MKNRLAFAAIAALVGLIAATTSVSAGGRGSSVDVLTYHNDNTRTGQNLHERELTPETVSAQGRFGRVFTWPVDGQVYAQPLYASGVRISGKGKHNVVFVATEHDTLYAFDADDPSGVPLWKRSFLDPIDGVTPVPSDEVNSGTDLFPEIGITGTPVIDKDSGTLYVVAKTKENYGEDGFRYVQRLHAIDIGSGDERKNSPVKIDALVKGTGDGNRDGIIHFSARRQHQRAGLLLDRGIVYIGWGSHADHSPYQGWVMAYDARSLAQVAAWNDAPNGGLGGIWMSAAGISADDAGDIYFASGNGSADPSVGSYGDSFVRMTRDDPSGLRMVDFFMPFNHEILNTTDADLSTGLLLLPDDDATNHQHLLIGGGKQGWLYVVNRDRMGHVLPDRDDIVQRFNPGGSQFGMAALYKDTVYYTGIGTGIKAFAIANGKLREAPLTETATHFGFPGCTPSVSADGDQNGIVWAIVNGTPGSLHAYDAGDLRRELFSSQARAQDDLGPAIKFSVPTVANGRVYVGGATRVTVYGLLPANENGSSPTSAVSGSAANGQSSALGGPPAGLVGRWGFDEGSGVMTRDTSLTTGQSDADAAIQGEVAWIGGVVGSGALDFHGVGNAISRVVIPDRPRFLFGAGQSFTFSLWVNMSPAAPADYPLAILTRANPTPNATPSWGLFVGPNRTWVLADQIALNGSSLQFKGTLFGGTATPGWHYIALVQDAQASQRKLYVDGSEIASTVSSALDEPGDLWLGAAENLPHSSFIGSLDDFRIYNRALTKDEINALIGLKH